MLTFKASEQLDPKKTWHKTPQQLFINITLEIEDDKPCVYGFSEWSRDIHLAHFPALARLCDTTLAIVARAS
ncbi:MAG: hypothetical protein ACK5YU_00495 [Burkholderiales bacterium]|jgi:hypothetical protein|nr:hypothetical protein [Betaproteobacteria bacterium]